MLHELGTMPRVERFDEPVPGRGELVLDVLAAGVNHLDLGKASGRFYGDTPALPAVVGTDGVGRDPDGRRVYFDETIAPFGAYAERTLVDREHLVAVPDGVSDEAAAVLGNAGVAAMTALSWRGRLQAGESVLVLGATGAVGHLAVQLARLLGAGRVVAVGRDAERLERLRALGADDALDLDDHADPGARLAAAGAPFDLIVDLLWGTPAITAMGAAASGARLIQLGQLAGAEVTLPAALLRSRMLTLHGLAGVNVAAPVRSDAYAQVTAFAAAGELDVDFERVALDDIAGTWVRQQRLIGVKMVVVP
ncbi:zinc-binding alcohol dehydrogenase family protein [Conexibacter sp. CPCC 206217]|uniref:quinone oxidoreductase family protein n=1 Tax=Conexibacter sp. CPCC 206217 TaxID=3064574 RepID=UPI00271A2614|nr:zinc-binding alcohol dehydrogenase family protein [Conexibacter sp. CPCC 206217]MDO8210135.1 zinc-binding alcohol dehydrogenase family protein [Conexibacter sp. CPCC 206217]